MTLVDLQTVPPAWRDLVAFVNGLPTREPRGPGDEDCEAFDPGAPGFGDCDTDGHYRCSECTQISERVIRRRRGQCEECGLKLTFGPGPIGYSSREPDRCLECDP